MESVNKLYQRIETKIGLCDWFWISCLLILLKLTSKTYHGLLFLTILFTLWLCVRLCVITEIKSAFSLLGPNHVRRRRTHWSESHFPIKSYTSTHWLTALYAENSVHEFWNNGQERCSHYYNAIKNSVSQKFSLNSLLKSPTFFNSPILRRYVRARA